MTDPGDIVWALLDGKRGHENQVLGLAEALARQGAARIETISFPHDERIWKRFDRLRSAIRERRRPRFILGAGHTTHLLLFCAARRTGGRGIVLMKPSLPERLFDLCVVPAHDLPAGAGNTPRRLVTLGALNRICYEPERKDGRGLFLIGGPSREHGWETENLVGCLRQIVKADPGREWFLTTSRRTPPDFLPAVRDRLPDVESIDAAETAPDWLPGQLSRAEVAWVTRDSVSMVYEALTAGAKVGLLDVPLRTEPGKLTRGLDRLLEQGYVTDWPTWNEKRELVRPPAILEEADRCAAAILRKYG